MEGFVKSLQVEIVTQGNALRALAHEWESRHVKGRDTDAHKKNERPETYSFKSLISKDTERGGFEPPVTLRPHTTSNQLTERELLTNFDSHTNCFFLVRDRWKCLSFKWQSFRPILSSCRINCDKIFHHVRRNNISQANVD